MTATESTDTDSPIAGYAGDTMRSIAEMIVSTVILPALRDLGVLADVTEISAGILHISLNLGGLGTVDDSAGPPAPATLGTVPPGKATPLRRFAGSADAF